MQKNRVLEDNFKNLAVLLFFSGIILGMLSANLLFKNYLEQAGMLGSAFLMKYRYAKIDSGSLLFYLAKTRLLPVVILGGVGFAGWGIFCVLLYCGWLGFSAGMLFSMVTIQKGLSGMVLALAALLPQYLAYLPGTVLLFYAIFNRWRRQRSGHGQAGINAQYMLLIAAVLVLYVAGIFAETYVNPAFVKKLLKNY